ncbi:MAG: adenosylcobinamide-GDP ribazoletransferase [Candidatus Protistobacter heckmanni]|nr:adenosylcobinamide-GDP ribazoletransferase [Candidatus Protistobacter heckmanni]
MHRMPRDFLVAITYFTRLPLPAALARRIGHGPEGLDGAAAYFPAVGLLAGVVSTLIFLGFSAFLPLRLAVLLAMIGPILLSGAMHEDGLADSCDGLGGGATREDALRIMRDSRIGVFGALGLALVLLLRFESLAALPAAWLPALLLAAQPASRFVAISLMRGLDYARAEGKAQPVAQQMPLARLLVAALFGLPLLLLLPWMLPLPLSTGLGLAAAILLALALLRWRLGAWLRRRLGGYTGDCLGMAQQFAEVLIYLTACAWISR